MKYDFDKQIERWGTDSVKYDLLRPVFGHDDLIPMWLADMDFEVADFIRDAISEKIKREGLEIIEKSKKEYTPF